MRPILLLKPLMYAHSLSASYRAVLVAIYHQKYLSFRPSIRFFAYSLHRPGGVRSLLGVEMPSWIVECSKCKFKFKHSAIDDVGMSNYFLPLKPELPPAGTELKCPDCGYKATYQPRNLRYRAESG